jgi:hypothetical protein
MSTFRDATHSPARVLRSNLVSVLVGAAILLGLVLRLVQYAANRSLWFDEALLALNILHRSAASLTATLDFRQVTPIGFLEAERFATHALGASELALRLLPLLLGLASVPLFALLALRILAPAAAVVASTVFACAPGAVYYSSELKQYSGDVAVGVTLLVLALALLDPSTSRRRRIAAAVVGAIVIPLSTASVFVVGGVAVTFGVRFVFRRDRRSTEAVAAIGLWLVSAVGLVVFTATRASQLESALGTGGVLFPTGSTAGGHLQWPQRVASGIWRSAGFPDSAPERYLHWPLAGLAVIGLLSLARRKPAVASMIVLPFAVMTVASALHRYPVFDRTVLFLVPASLLLVAEGISAVAALARAGPARYATAAVLAAAVAVVPVVHAAGNAVDPIKHEEVKSVLEHIRGAWQPGDALFVDSDTGFVLRYYLDCGCLRAAEPGASGLAWDFAAAPARDGHDPEPLRSVPPRFVVGELAVRSLGDFVQQLHGFRPARIWLLYSHSSSPTDDTLTAGLLRTLDRRARRLDAFDAVGAHADLYDLRVIRR